MNILVSYCFAEVIDLLPFRTILRLLLVNKAFRILFMARYSSNIEFRKRDFFKGILFSLGGANVVKYIKPVLLDAFIDHFVGFNLPIKILTCTYACVNNEVVIIGVLILNTFWRILLRWPSKKIECVGRGPTGLSIEYPGY